jgi:hydroxymethylpyrimidine/phosphomethylpyrimidine kinase
MSETTVPPVLTVAGSDPSGGAGQQADLKTFHALGVYGMSVLTLATDCTTEGVDEVETLPPAFIQRQLERVSADLPPAVVKTGMLLETEIVDTVREALGTMELSPLVVDPVMTTTQGERLLSDDAEEAMRRLVGEAFVTTPSRPEAERLLEAPLASRSDRAEAARALADLGARHVVITGGHDTGPQAADVWFDGADVRWLEAERAPYGVRGTGDTFSAALTAALAKGKEIGAALQTAKAFVTNAIRAAPDRGKTFRPLHPVPM